MTGWPTPTILADNPINSVSNELDRMRMAFIGVHLPTWSHLRLMAAVVHTNVALERIGDYAVTICREAVQIRASARNTRT